MYVYVPCIYIFRSVLIVCINLYLYIFMHIILSWTWFSAGEMKLKEENGLVGSKSKVLYTGCFRNSVSNDYLLSHGDLVILLLSSLKIICITVGAYRGWIAHSANSRWTEGELIWIRFLCWSLIGKRTESLGKCEERNIQLNPSEVCANGQKEM